MKEQTQGNRQWHELFYKERLLLQLTCEDLPDSPSSPEGNFTIQRFPSNQIPASVRAFLSARIQEKVLTQRLACPDVDLFLAVDTVSQEPLGYYWSLVSVQKTYFHDAFRIPLGTALVFNAYVIEEYRKKGIYSHLIVYAHHYLLEEKGCSRVYTIVEKRNLASLGANLKNNLKVSAHNSLIKFCGRNIFSTYRNGSIQFISMLIKPRHAID
jgi:GNAT superfamily N-acetyltransferase